MKPEIGGQIHSVFAGNPRFLEDRRPVDEVVVVTDRKGARGVRSLARLTVVDLSRFSGFATEAPLDVR
jgi:hypothetical protein